jgi:hypothetical protein
MTIKIHYPIPNRKKWGQRIWDALVKTIYVECTDNRKAVTEAVIRNIEPEYEITSLQRFKDYWSVSLKLR